MKADKEINQWIQARRSEVPEPPEDFTDRVLNQLESGRSISPLIWFCRFVLVALVAVLAAGRLLATALVFLTSTSTQ
jgi:hypothetical protein